MSSKIIFFNFFIKSYLSFLREECKISDYKVGVSLSIPQNSTWKKYYNIHKMSSSTIFQKLNTNCTYLNIVILMLHIMIFFFVIKRSKPEIQNYIQFKHNFYLIHRTGIYVWRYIYTVKVKGGKTKIPHISVKTDPKFWVLTKFAL